MIKVNGIELNAGNFPDGSLSIFNAPIGAWEYIIFEWHYESDVEALELVYLVNHYRQLNGNKIPVKLFMPYIPNARMDRVKNTSEVFTLKWFAKLINSLEFDVVYVIDPHSDVSTALIDRVKVLNVSNYISKAIEYIRDHNDRNSDFVIYFPDNGAYKRYKDLSIFEGMTKVYGKKVRDWKTGTILGLEVVDENENKLTENYLSKKKVLMIDDIISYGGTFYYSVLELKKYNPLLIYAYATHVEPKSLWDPEKGKFGKLIEDRTVEKLYTTNSIYNDIEHKNYVITFKVDNTIV